ncbi:MAG: thioredoxin family protein [Brevundimonas sp.]|nr:thioredoxin family protein [Brevundimonas sp.]
MLGLMGAGPATATAPASPAAVATPVAAADAVRRSERIEAELVPMSAWAAPGSTAVVAVRQKIAPGWHTYWRNPGDSGGATTLEWTLPPGVTAGEIVWPTPERQRLLSLMNYGYSGAVYLPVPIEVPASARPGTTLPLKVEVLFLVCSDQMCVPELMTLTLDLPVREGAAPLDPLHGAAVERTLTQAPRPAPIEARMTQEGQTLTLSATGGPLAEGPVSWAWFFPFKGGLIDHAAAQPGVAGPDGLTLTLTAGRGLTPEALAGGIEGLLQTDRGGWYVTAQAGAPLAGASGGAALADPEAAGAASGAWSLGGLVRAALLALLGGLVLNLMPCVFPVLAMKAAALARGAHDRAEARRDGLMFLAGVLVAFAVLAGALLGLRAAGQAVGWGFQLQSPMATGALALLMLAVGLNLSGVYGIGAGLQGAGSGRLSRLPGGAGAFFTGVLAVVVAAPCTAPFMAAALGAALVMPWPAAMAVFLMLGLGLALPYLAVSLTPGLLERLPRPGPWMERLRGVLAFPMYATAAWLLWVFARQTGAEALGLLLIGALFAAFGLWLVGINQARRAEGGTAVISAVAATLSLVAAVAVTAAAARIAPDSAVDSPGAATALPSQAWSPQAVRAALAQGRPVLVNFTADWCVTCKINERTALSSPRLAQAMQRANAVYLVGDWTRRDDAITRELERHGRSGVPLYLLYRPGQAEPRILPQLLTDGLVIEALER